MRLCFITPLVCMAFFATHTAYGQAPTTVTPSIVVSAYEQPQPLLLTPGQIVTVYATGIGSKVTSRVSATSQPWPTQLAGISAELAGTDWKAAIGQVEPVVTCPVYVFGNSRPCGRLLAVTIQAPFELQSELLPTNSKFSIALRLRDDDGTVSGAADVFPTGPQPRILRDCFVTRRPNVDGVVRPNRCDPIVLHADGSRVTQSSPAFEGEALVMYLYGLGGYPAAKTGHASGTSVDMRENYSMNYTFGPNLQLTFSDDQVPLAADYIGAAPTEVGLYQANFRVPKIPDGLVACSSNDFFGRQSNLSVGLRLKVPVDQSGQSRSLPFDWADLCVDPASRP